MKFEWQAGMLKNKVCINFLITVVILGKCCAQPSYFTNPLGIPIDLSANFGDIRSNHFHTGYDIRTNGTIGYRVYAAASGYVSRIKVSPFGYGNAIYITHPNGLMTVYGHLDHFNDTIAAWVKKKQYELHRYEVDLHPSPAHFVVKQGDVIAISGNSGGSTGPHLHFEVRDASGETYPLNPGNYLPLDDHEPPHLYSLYIYSLSGRVNEPPVVRQKLRWADSDYHAEQDTIIVNDAAIGLGITGDDAIRPGGPGLGLYRLQSFFDGTEIFSMIMDRLDFAKGRYVNAHIDYAAWKTDGIAIQKTFVLPGDHNTLYDELLNRGVLTLHDTLVHQVKIVAADDAGNSSAVTFNIRFSGEQAQVTDDDSVAQVFHYNKENLFERDSIKLVVPANVLYNNMNFTYQKSPAADSRYLSASFLLGDPFIPMHSYARVYIVPHAIPKALKEKALLVHKKENGGFSTTVTHWDGKYLEAKIRDFGTYFIALDTIAPSVRVSGLAQNQWVRGERINFKVSDNLSGIGHYQAKLDGKWFLLQYDAKDDIMFCDLEKNLTGGTHSLVVNVSDAVGNKTQYSFRFKK